MKKLPIATKEVFLPFIILLIAQAAFLSVNLFTGWFYREMGIIIPMWVIDVPVIIIFVIAVFLLYFYRDPERKINAEKGRVLSPADGRVISVEKNAPCKYLKGNFSKLSIFMNLRNVHVQRMPVAGTVEDVSHYIGKNYAAYKKAASEQNQQNVFIMKGKNFDFVVKQITGVLVRKTISWVKKGDRLEAGDRIGMITFGSRVELFLPPYVKLDCFEGDKVKAGLTAIGTYTEPEGKKNIKRKKSV